MYKLRMKFCKEGKAVYISHLDLMRTIQRAFNRAFLPLAYSEGFNPHAKISVILPLSVGASSVCEYADFGLNEELPTEGMAGKLSAVMPEGIKVLEVYEPTTKGAEAKWLSVSGRLEYDNISDLSAMAASLTDYWCSGNEISLMKKTKRGEGEFKISDHIRSISFSVADGYIALKALISAQEPTVNPDNIVSALRQNRPEIAPDFAAFTRLELYKNNMKIFR